ncbi:chaperone modulator CbpM [Aquimarina sp. W85]|uniref:chaperone modulator CbpM n=1 Tax=Aquimarina rhodophyticola TaxID=3342246 RepID=UPI0036710A50
MITKEYILTQDLCNRYNINTSFVKLLEEKELIEIYHIKEKYYIHIDQIGRFEHILRLNTELGVNIDGIEVIQHLLNKIEKLQQVNLKLRNRLQLFE